MLNKQVKELAYYFKFVENTRGPHKRDADDLTAFFCSRALLQLGSVSYTNEISQASVPLLCIRLLALSRNITSYSVSFYVAFTQNLNTQLSFLYDNLSVPKQDIFEAISILRRKVIYAILAQNSSIIL